MINGPGISARDSHSFPTDWSQIVVRTARLTLRPLQEGDLAASIAALRASEAHFAPWLPAAADIGVDSVESLAQRQFDQARSSHADHSACRVVGVDSHGRLVGAFNLNNIVRGVLQNTDAGWSVNTGFTRQGFATEAMAAMLRLALLPQPRPAEPLRWGGAHGLGLHRVQAAIIPANTASLGVARKLGLRHEGLARRYVKIAGLWQDHDLFAVTSEELASLPIV